jgi:DNA-binding MarR family transcriptional regulator
MHTSRAVNKYYNAFLNKDLGLSISQIAILTALDTNGGVMHPSEIARITYTERNNISTLVARMSEEGLVRTERDSEDKRLVNVSLTEKGKQVFEKAKPIVHKAVERLVTALSEDNAYLFERPLRILRQNAQDGINEL